MKVFLDTSTMIDIMGGNDAAIAAVDRLAGECELCTSTINIYEMQKGVLGRSGEHRQLRAIEDIIANLNVLPFDSRAAEAAARAYSALRAKGKPVSEVDYLIAGICASNEIWTIVTNNKRHFEGMPEIEKVVTY